MFFDSGTTIDLTAPKDGPLAGILFFEDRKALPLRIHRIGSNNARNLVGTIYLPLGILFVDANAPVADNSAYTALVVRSLQLSEGPNLVLHSDYKSTDIPVPDGLIVGRPVLNSSMILGHGGSHRSVLSVGMHMSKMFCGPAFQRDRDLFAFFFVLAATAFFAFAGFFGAGFLPAGLAFTFFAALGFAQMAWRCLLHQGGKFGEELLGQ